MIRKPVMLELIGDSEESSNRGGGEEGGASVIGGEPENTLKSIECNASKTVDQTKTVKLLKKKPSIVDYKNNSDIQRFSSTVN